MSTEADLTVTNSLTVTAGENGNLFAQFTPVASKAVVNGRLGVATLNPANALDVAGSVALGNYAGTLTVPNSLILDGSLGIGTTTPSTKLHVKNAPTTGDASGIVAEVTGNAGSSDATSLEVTTTVNGPGNGYGITSNVVGNGNAVKTGVLSTVGGPGFRVAGSFTSSNPGTDSQTSYGLSTSSYGGTGVGYAYGNVTYATGDGSGDKCAYYGYAYGNNGYKYGGQFYASTWSSTSTSLTRGLFTSAYSAGTGVTTAVDADASGSGSASKYGVDASATHTGSSYGYAVGLNGTASNSGQGSALGMTCSATGTNNVYNYGFSASAFSSGSGGAWSYGGSISTENDGGAGGCYGLLCAAGGSSSGTKYGLYAYAWGNGPLYAAYFSGHVHVAGQLTKTSGTFLIDHPLDPYNKVLRHNFVESPEELCVYRGKVKLDGTGQATVAMPSYFIALTKEDEATVTVSPIGRKAFLTSYEWNAKFDGFTVYGDPNAQVSYLVLACRDDPAIHVLRRPVEEDKAGDEKGKLLFPDAYPDPKAPPKAATEIRDPVILAERTRFKNEMAVRDSARTDQRDRSAKITRAEDQQLKQFSDAQQVLASKRATRDAAAQASVPKTPFVPKGTTPKK